MILSKFIYLNIWISMHGSVFYFTTFRFTYLCWCVLMCSCIVLQVNKWNWINHCIVLTYLTVDKKLHVAQRRQAIVSGIILDMGSFNERRRYIVTSSLIGWVHTGDDPCVHFDLSPKRMRRTQDTGWVYSTQNYTWKYYIRSTLQNNTNMLDKYEPDKIKNAEMHFGRPLLRS